MSNEQIAFALSRIGVLLKSQAWEQAEPLGTNPTQAQILSRVMTRGPSRVRDLAADLGVSQPTVSDAVAALVRKGLLDRAPDPGDGRAVRLHLTLHGRQVAQAVMAPPPVLIQALDTLAPADRNAMQRALVGVIRALQQARAIPVQRMCVTCAHFRPHTHNDADSPHHCAFVNTAFGDADLRIDCGDHEDATPDSLAPLWAQFSRVA
ncbi:MAG: MarR family winged helix-turn-helix transcriptional regulator [Cypionkella sp.]